MQLKNVFIYVLNMLVNVSQLLKVLRSELESLAYCVSGLLRIHWDISYWLGSLMIIIFFVPIIVQ